MLDKNILKWIGIILIVITGIIHFIEAPEYFDEARYLGMLFTLNGIGSSLLAAYGIFKNELLGWLVGFLIAFGSIIGYIVSRTVGLPNSIVKNWFEFMGLLSLIVEGLFILFAYSYLNGRRNYPENFK